MKVIDLLNKIANGEEVPNYIKINDFTYHFGCDDGDYYNDIENAPSLLERIWRHNALVWLNIKVEIIGDEFIDIEELPFNNGMNNLITMYEEIEKMNYKINDLIKNQKKIIERLNK